MPTIVGPTLPEPYYGRVEDVWADIDETVGDNGIVNPYPHVTLYGLDLEADVDALESTLAAVAEDHEPVPLHTTGVGVFPGDHVWMPVTRSEPLAALHRDVVDAMGDLGSPPTPYYEPHRWFPHIGLGLRFDSDTAGDVVTHLNAGEDFCWDFTVDNLQITRMGEGDEAFDRVGSVSL